MLNEGVFIPEILPPSEDGIYSFRDKNGELLSDAVGIVFVELSKLGAIIAKPVEEMSGAEMWSVFFWHANEPKYRDILKQMIEAKEEIKVASELLMNISKDEIERAHYRSRKMYLMDEEHKAAVRKKAIETLQNEVIQSKIEGKIEGKIEVAKKLLNMNLSVDDIIEATALTRSEVEALLAESSVK
jgi:predicted transposase/invertase (TIGR01784 family)